MSGGAPAGTVQLVGIISDTHGLLRAEAISALAGCDLIIHAGDIGTHEVLDRLREIAPVAAVRGNVDVEAWAQALPETEVVEALGARLYVLHDRAGLDLDPEAAGFAAVIYGHSHRPEALRKRGVLYLNPGSAGPRRFRLPVTMARVRLERGIITPEIIELPV